MPDSDRTDIVEYLVLVASEVGYFGYIMQFEPEDMLTFSKNFMTDYDGIIRIYDLERTLKSEEYFEEGEQLSDEAGRIKTFTSCSCSYQTNNGPATGVDISYQFSEVWILCICENDGGGRATYIPNEIGTIVSSPGSFSNNGTGSGGGSGQGGTGSISTGNGEELGFDGEVILDIINELTDPCLKATSEIVLNESLEDEYNSIIQDAFNVSDEVNLIISDNTPLEANVAGLTDIEESLFGDINVTIALNKVLLGSTTQELIAATIYHEAFHALLLFFDHDNEFQPTPTDHHIDLFNGYVQALGNALCAAFPSLDSRDAKGLILKGILPKSHWDSLYDSILEKNNFGFNLWAISPFTNRKMILHNDGKFEIQNNETN